MTAVLTLDVETTESTQGRPFMLKSHVSEQATGFVDLRSATYTLVATATDVQGEPVEIIKAIPGDDFDSYVAEAMLSASIERLEKGSWFAEIALMPGVWGEGDSKAAASADLAGALEEWLFLKIVDEDRDLPVLAHIDLNRF